MQALAQMLGAMKYIVKKADMVLLGLCLLSTGYGIVLIASATNFRENTFRYILIQSIAALLGVGLYFLFSNLDMEHYAEKWWVFLLFNLGFIALLLTPLGVVRNNSRAWLSASWLPMDIQPAEICKIFYILITASVMGAYQNRISHPKSVLHTAFYLILIVGLNMVLSDDLGVSLIFIFIFLGMTFSGGVSILWFLGGIGLLIIGTPFLWNYFLSGHQKERIEVLFNPDIDPLGIDERYHTVRSLRSLTGGGMTGQGLFQGYRTQSGALYAQHTDYIFSSIGEELGYVGCMLTIVLLLLIVARCFWVGYRSQDYMRRLICFGAASALIFQIIINVGMCIGVAPVIGLTLPFISYGGSSILSMYAMLGLVSGVYARPFPTSHDRYIRAPYGFNTLR